ncbi:MAG: UDP-N-acetylmuramate:L-alanyl-gamma-D-glutamyl-meso-diaminopimelate ligase [Deltaproteobacteria bacterium]|nr:UDP-N-acetylmuramate:L-alanyl-gamma-D-glutamyl-meso-diaminopimelate ligase [Deltaproteobacteria bacterium]NND28403.1 UDP-N-acetylmuramate:L-alanyl-gamma-D-glutamyl-meso-diaminopimelate ligase [Myxococcales bacterium]MBT8465989.1 UDP-N-acetylmuramate:L-alanyl-gamma-D-glutamyl-meso-diaminopimelate ligase [Deltaproteobacteria bacterium]MBT8483272.1 UDP-N-acetylmuramate:L-alanyl-gamma-D-glutamyl-meso-diaminopimelate ligase [Deltaproteobacteria bacterium]NNK05729.1 UDP-N-acetylmuramate:L-alanyl-g
MHVHLIGIAGTGMSALAALLVEAGHRVSGSDTAFDPPVGPYLEELGVECLEGWRSGNLDRNPDLVVVGNVCRRDNPEAQEAMSRELPTLSMPAALAAKVLSRRKSLVVAGTHGKTTTSALLAYLLRQAGMDAGFFIGGIPLNFDRSSRLGSEGLPFVVEGDEYDSAFFEKEPKFWSYHPSAAILTSIEYDHVDIYPNAEAYISAFRRFVELIPNEGWLFAWAGDPVVREVSSRAHCKVRFYALEGDDCGEVQPMWLGMPAPGGAMDLFGGGSLCGRASLPLLGQHNARNTVAALAMASEAAGAPLDRLIAALPGFRGTKRRQELVGVSKGVEVYDDFAHHPSAVKETLAGFRERAKGRLIAVFEPRSATASRRLHQDDYADAFAPADVCILAPVGRTGIPAEEKLDTKSIAEAISSRGGQARACESVEEAVEAAATEAEPGDTIVVMSNGRFDDAPDRILLALVKD